MTKIKIPLKPKLKPKRKAGTKAGLTKATIAAEAAKQLEAGSNEFSLRGLAKAMDVVPTSIHSHFKGGVFELFDEVVKATFKDVARPYKPKEEAVDYLCDLFLGILKSLRGKPTIAVLAVQRLSLNPVLVPFLAERTLASLSALEVSPEAVPKFYMRSLDLISEMIVNESFRSKAPAQQASSKRVDDAIAALAPTEFPHLAEFRKGLVAEVATGAPAAPTAKVAQRYANRLVAMVDAFKP